MRNKGKWAFRISDTMGLSFNRKVGSSSMSLAIIDALYPEVAGLSYHFPDDGKGRYRVGWQGMVPKLEDPAVMCLLVREPVERFRSAMAQANRTNVAATLGHLEAAKLDPTLHINQHFGMQYIQLGDITSKLYKFEDHMENLRVDLGLGTLPFINKRAEGDKPTLNAAQRTRCLELYAEDLALWESIVTAGQIHQT